MLKKPLPASSERRLFRFGGAGWSSPVARQAHNLKVVGSNPTPATTRSPLSSGFFVVLPPQPPIFITRPGAIRLAGFLLPAIGRCPAKRPH
jgi:hypothetical protein